MTTKMSTIHVLTETLKDGYAPILQYYNTNKPFHWNPILEGGFAEGGFEIKLEHELLQEAKKDRYYDKNSVVRQVRWCKGKLESGLYIPLTEEQTVLLFQALQHSLGKENVVLC